jgi:ribosomal protein S7
MVTIKNFIKTKFNKDLFFNSLWVSKIINISTKHTIKHKIENKYYKTFYNLKIYYKIPPILYIYNTLRKQKLLFKILKVRVAGRIYQLPTNFNFFNRYSTALRWLILNISKYGNFNFSDRVTKYLINDSLTKNNITDKTRLEIYKTITSYRGYLHFRWRN